ncbi:MAG: TonB C-terminal domain-containing protein [Candidatus Dependentiae bacterium]|nr:TonB C-terminal domain-containing protein [Candidatus Dependentiae bacterium]
MWLWLQKKLPKVLTLWAKLFIFTTGIHAGLLFVMLFMYKGDSAHYAFSINQAIDADAVVVFLPLQKKVYNAPRGKKGGRGKSACAAQAKPVAKPAAPVEKAAKETTVATPAEPKKVIAPKKSKTETAQDATSKKDKAKKNKQEKVKVPEKVKEKLVEKVVEKPAEKVVEKLPEEELKKEELQPLVVPDMAATGTQESSTEGDGSPNIRYVGQDDLDAMYMQDAVIQEVAQHWRPPVGISKDRVCVTTITIDWNGKVKKIKIDTPSGVPMYDISTRSAALATQYPKSLWGKECTITFKQ